MNIRENKVGIFVGEIFLAKIKLIFRERTRVMTSEYFENDKFHEDF